MLKRCDRWKEIDMEWLTHKMESLPCRIKAECRLYYGRDGSSREAQVTVPGNMNDLGERLVISAAVANYYLRSGMNPGRNRRLLANTCMEPKCIEKMHCGIKINPGGRRGGVLRTGIEEYVEAQRAETEDKFKMIAVSNIETVARIYRQPIEDLAEEMLFFSNGRLAYRKQAG